MAVFRSNRLVFALIISSLLVLAHGEASETSTPDYEDGDDPDVPSTHVPKFISETKEFTVREGEQQINLPCEVDKIGSHSTVWLKGYSDDILYADNIKIHSDKSYIKEDDRSLTIKNLKANHSDVYICQINSEPKVVLTHKVNVLVPPKITYHPKQEFTLQKGQPLNLTCEASGNPTPTITWKKLEGPELPNGSPVIENGVFLVKAAKKIHTGTYECTAKNGIGEQRNAIVRVKVLYKPEIQVNNPMVHSGEGVSSELSCTVHADPMVSVHWERHGKRIHSNEHLHATHNHDRYILHLKRVKKEDFGPYICVAKNPLGINRAEVQLSGLATPVVFKSNANGNELDSYMLKWTTNSYSRVVEYLLKLREKLSEEEKKEGTGSWLQNVTIPAESQNGLMQSQMYEITGLKEATSYEVVMSVHNEFGWNKDSEVFAFTTKGGEEMTSHQPLEDAPDMAGEQGDEDSSTPDLVDASQPHTSDAAEEEDKPNGASITEPVAIRVGIFSLMTVFILSSFF